MKKIITFKNLFIVLFALISCVCGSFFSCNLPLDYALAEPVALAITSGDGSQNSPYVIDGSEKLFYMAQQINNGVQGYSTAYYIQTANIDISSSAWTMISSFNGNYDGQGYTISGLNGSEKNFAFINKIEQNGTIKNLGFINVNLSIDTNTDNNLGTFALYCYGNITNCFASGTIYTVNDDTSDLLYVGGLVAYVEGGTISNCYSAVNITVQSQAGVSVWKNVGGIAGRLNSGLIENCYSIGNLSVSNDWYWRMGGIVARAEGGSANNCAFLKNTCKSSGGYQNSLTNASTSSSNTTLKGSNNVVVEQSVLKSSTSSPLSNWEWNNENQSPRVWGFVTDTTSAFYNSGYPQLRVFYENFNVNFYTEDGQTLLATKTTRYPQYAVNFDGVTAPDKIGHTFNNEFTSQINGGIKYSNQLENIYSNTNLYATYDINYYKLEIKTSNSLAAEVSLRDEMVAYNSNIVATVGQENVGYKFLEWRNYSDNSTLSTQKEFSFNMPTHDYSIYAYFSQETYFVKAAINNTNYGTVSGVYDYYTVGQSVQLTAVPSPGYKVDKFYTEDGEVLSTSNTYEFTMIRDNVVVYVDFVKATYNLTILAYPNDVAEMVGQGQYYMGDKVEISFLNVQQGYNFACWKVDELDKTPADNAETTYLFNMPGKDTTIYCYFLTDNYSYIAFHGLTGNIYYDTVVQNGSNVTPPAPQEINNYNFVGWFDSKENGQQIASFDSVNKSFNAYAVYERIFNCNFTISTKIINQSEYNSNLNTSLFISLKSPNSSIYTFSVNSYNKQTFKLTNEGDYTFTYALPTYYKAKVYLKDQELFTNKFNVDINDEDLELSFVVYNSNDYLMYESFDHIQSQEGDIYNVSPNVIINGENYYEGINGPISNMEFEQLNNEQIPTSPYNYELSDVLGATNWGGLYNFTSLNYLVEGGKFVSEDLGSSVYKVSFANHYSAMYPFNEDWGNSSINTMTDLAKTPAYSQLFSLPKLKTYILVAYEFVYCPWERVITNGYTLETMEIYYNHVIEEFADLTEHLLLTYPNKTFILSNWEGDNAYGAYFDMCTTDQQKQLLTDAYTGYINARQDGIILGRSRVNNSTAKVYGNFEVCHIGQNIPYVPNRWRLVDVAVPNTYCDLYSFSDWYSYLQDENGNYTFPLESLLSTLYSAAQNNLCYKNPQEYPLNPDFVGKKNVMVTEFGADENTDAKFNDKIKHEIETAIEWGAYKVVYWGIYSNVRLNQNTTRPTNEELQGLWLVRPDGSFTKAFWYIKSIITGIDYVTNTPKIVFSTSEPCSFTWENVKNKIGFYDDLTDFSKIKDFSSDKLILTTLNPESADYKYFEEYNKYFSSVDATGIVQSKIDDNLTYITYQMHSNRFGVFLYNYTSIDQYTYSDLSKLDELIIFEGKNKSGDWEKITNIKIEQNAAPSQNDGVWFQTFITGTTKIGEYLELRISITNKGYNPWDPIITGVAFFDGGEV